jgi:hypothetical protein
LYIWSISDKVKRFHNLGHQDYRKKVRKLVLSLLDRHLVKTPITADNLHWILMMGMEHEKIHLETSAVIIAQVPTDLVSIL